MGVIKALKTSWNTNLNKIEKKVIAKMEEHTQKPLTPKQMKKAHKKAKKIFLLKYFERTYTLIYLCKTLKLNFKSL